MDKKGIKESYLYDFCFIFLISLNELIVIILNLIIILHWINFNHLLYSYVTNVSNVVHMIFIWHTFFDPKLYIFIVEMHNKWHILVY